MNNKDEMFREFDIDLETADKVAKEYPSLSDEARKRMFDMTKKKINITNNSDEDNGNSVHGVEKYDRPKWIKFAGMAAAFALIAGSIGGGSYLLRKMKDSAPAVSSSSQTEPASGTSTAAETDVSSVTTSTTATTAETETTSTTAAAEITTEAAEPKEMTPEEETAHRLTDNYWEYECFFHSNPHSENDSGTEGLHFSYTMQYDGWTSDTGAIYMKTTDERLTDKTMDGLKKLYYTYYGKNFDPFYSPNAEYTHNYELFGPSFTADTLPADGKLDRLYSFIEYEGELYQRIIPSYYGAEEHWSDDQIDISDVTENSFTAKRKIHNPPKPGELPGEFTFKIAFDEDAQDWRIEQVDEEYEYPDTSATGN